jgi:hypothetical protein
MVPWGMFRAAEAPPELQVKAPLFFSPPCDLGPMTVGMGRALVEAVTPLAVAIDAAFVSRGVFTQVQSSVRTAFAKVRDFLDQARDIGDDVPIATAFTRERLVAAGEHATSQSEFCLSLATIESGSEAAADAALRPAEVDAALLAYQEAVREIFGVRGPGGGAGAVIAVVGAALLALGIGAGAVLAFRKKR